MAGQTLKDQINAAKSRHALRRAQLLRQHEERMNHIVYKPRNDFVLYRRVKRAGLVRGLAMPDAAAEGVKIVIEAVGPDVTGLNVGDEVLAIGTPGQDVVLLPGQTDLYLTRQSNVVCVVLEGELT